MRNDYKLRIEEYLKNHQIFLGCSLEDLQLLINNAKTQSFSKGQVIFSKKNRERCIGIIVDGQARVSKGVENQVIISKLYTGELFGAVTLFASQSGFINTIIADSDCTVIFFSYESVLEVMERQPLVWQNYIRYLSDRIYFLNDRIDEFTATNTTAKLALYLDERANEENEFTILMSMTTLSKALDIGRSSLYRAMDELCHAGAINREGKSITVIDRDILNKYKK